MKFERYWVMPSRWTFTIRPIKLLLFQECGLGKNWVDPFCGQYSIAEIKNDLNTDRKADYHLDALDFLKMLESDRYDGVLYDPPYSISQAVECYKGLGKENFNVHKMDYWAECKNQIARIIKPSGKVICFGWNTNGLGKNRGFELQRIMILAHGGSKNDTLITVEIKK